MESRSIGFFGNCQVESIYVSAADLLREAGFSSFFVRNYRVLSDIHPVPSREQLDACVLTFEQAGPLEFPYRSGLPPGCATVRFPSLATNLLWPFQSINPYADPSWPGPYFAGNRVLLRAIERDWDADAIVAYYRDRYDEYRVDLTRMMEIERRRLRTLDATADVHVGDLVDDVISAPGFTSPSHPAVAVLVSLGRRLFARAARTVPELAALAERFDLSAVETDSRFGRGEIPIHPGIAADLGLAWYDPATTYDLSDGSRLTHDQYVRAFVESAIANRQRQRESGSAPSYVGAGFRPAVDGPAEVVGAAMGMYEDGFAAPSARFEIEASAPVAGFVVEGYYPPQHSRAATIACSLGEASAETSVEPGQAFELTVRAELAAGIRANLALTCSEALNMFERGEGDDSRDLGVLVLKLRAIAAT